MIEVAEVKSPYFKDCKCNACLIETATHELLIGRPKAQVHYLLCSRCLHDVKDAIDKALKVKLDVTGDPNALLLNKEAEDERRLGN